VIFLWLQCLQVHVFTVWSMINKIITRAMLETISKREQRRDITRSSCLPASVSWQKSILSWVPPSTCPICHGAARARRDHVTGSPRCWFSYSKSMAQREVLKKTGCMPRPSSLSKTGGRWAGCGPHSDREPGAEAGLGHAITIPNLGYEIAVSYIYI